MALVEFRDGKREVPDYLADVLRPYEDRMYRITYTEAMEFANRVMMSDHLDRVQARVVNDHFKRMR